MSIEKPQQPTATKKALPSQTQGKGSNLELPEEVLDKLREAIKSGSYLLAFFHINGTQVHLFRHCRDFPRVNFDDCLDLIYNDLNQEKESTKPAPRLPNG